MEETISQSILLVDDRPENLIVLESILETPGLNLIKANSGEEALRILLKINVALILLDVQMPGMDGFETATILRGAPNTKHIPIIFVTAISKEEKHVFKGYEAGAVDYLFKPVDPDILKSKVKVFLELDRRKKILEEKNFLLQEAKKNTDKILQNVSNGLFLLDCNLNFKPQYSTILEKILLQEKLENINFIQFLDKKVSNKIKSSCKDYLDLIYRNNVPESTLEILNPIDQVEITFNNGGTKAPVIKILSFTFKRIYNSDQEIDEIIATVTDVTEKVTLANQLKESEDHYKKQMELAFNILHVEPPLLKEFMEGAKKELNHIDGLLKNSKKVTEYSLTLEEIFRSIHLVKGNASLLDLKFFVNQAHKFEEQIIKIQEKDEITGLDFVPLVIELNGIQKTISEISDLIERIKNIHTHFRPKRQYENELFVQSLQNLTEKTASDLNKNVKLIHKDFDLGSIPYNSRLQVKEILIQLIRNSIYHGIEESSERKKSKKGASGSIKISTFGDDSFFGFKVWDDGRGLHLSKLRQVAISSGKWKKQEIDKWTDQQLIEIIFRQGISTSEKANHVAGRGVGLNVIKQKLEKGGGQIEVDFKKEKFCEFTITIPKVKK